MSFETFFSEKTLMVFVGTGGVGKTTSVAALGLAAAKKGKKVLLITVDPSKRLAAVLGVKPDQSVPREIVDSEITGQLHAVMVNPDRVFDEFLASTVRSEEAMQKLLKNRLYGQLKTRLSGSQEFTSLELLHRHMSSGEYDLILLDTPPAQNAIDFLQAPEKLHALFDSSVTKWFLETEQSAGFFKKIVATGSSRVLDSLANLTGDSFITELREFFQLAQNWQSQLSGRMKEVHRMLGEETTSFVLVTSFDEAKLAEAASFSATLKRKGYRAESLVLNKCRPDWLDQPDQTLSDSSLRLKQSIEKNFENQQEQYSQLSQSAVYRHVLRFPELATDVSSFSDLKQLLP